MAFENGSATDVFDLLDKIRSFASSQGWTINRFANDDELLLQNGSSYWNLKATNDVDSESYSVDGFDAQQPGIVCMGSTGFDSNEAWNNQPNNSTGDTAIGLFNETDVKEYWLFSNSSADYIHVVARIRSGVYAQLHMGDMVKFGSWTGGQYLAGTAVDDTPFLEDAGAFSRGDGGGHYRADIDGLSNAWQSIDDSPGSNRRTRGTFLATNADDKGDILDPVVFAAPSTWNGRSPLWPVLILLRRDNDKFAFAGYIPDMRLLNIKLLQPEESIAVGSDEWIVFPIAGKGEPTYNNGFAYRKIT